MNANPTASCPSSLDEMVTPYCFGDLTDAKREGFELHLMTCPSCWREVKRLSESVENLRSEPLSMPPFEAREIVELFGFSRTAKVAFAGHWAFVAAIAALHGLLYTASVWTELGYSYERFGALAWMLTPIIFGLATATLAVALWTDAKVTNQRKRTGLVWSVGVAFAGVTAILTICGLMMPGEPTIAATFQTRSAAAGYFKNVINYFLPALLFVLPTFHAIVALQHECAEGRHRVAQDCLENKPSSIAPRGAPVIPMWALVGLLGLGIVIGYHGVNNMLDHLLPGPYSTLFEFALYARVGLWYAIPIASLWWYRTSWNELKRECIAVERVQPK